MSGAQRAPATGYQADQGNQVVSKISNEATTTQRLEQAGRLLAQKKPWPAFLGISARGLEQWDSCPSPVREVLACIGVAGAGALGVVSVGPLEPVCQSFKALIKAAECTAESQEKLRRSISLCSFLITILIEHGRAVGPFAQIQKPIDDFVATINNLAAFAAKWAKGGKLRAFFFHRVNQATLTEYEKEICRIGDEIAFLDGLEHHQEFFGVARDLRPPPLPEMAAVPAEAPPEPHNFVMRQCLREAVDCLIHRDEALAPYTVVGMGGGGKTVLVSAVVRDRRVREHFRGGIFWLRVGRGAKNRLMPLLQGLAREMGAAPTDAPHGVPHVFHSLEQVKLHVSGVASTGRYPRLVVLDDVWEREVVNAFLSVKLKMLVTTRDRLIVDTPGRILEVGNMTDNEAVELLLKTSKATCLPGNEVQNRLSKVVALCGRLPLVLAIAGSMPAVKGKGLVASAWEELIKDFENVATKMESCGAESDNLALVLETSFNSLARVSKKNMRKMAVLAPGAIAPIDMLVNLWQMEDTEAAREEAESLSSKCLLQDMGGDRYRVHDLLLEFATIKIKIDVEMMEEATRLQAQYLAKPDVLQGYRNPEHGAGKQGLYILDALWRSIEVLSGNSELEVTSYRAMLSELESRDGNPDSLTKCCRYVGSLFGVQGKYSEAEKLYELCQAMKEKTLGHEHPRLAETLRSRADLLKRLGRYSEAEQLYERCQVIQEKTLGLEHPRLAKTLGSRAVLSQIQGRYSEAEQLYERCQTIQEKSLGLEHPDLAITLGNRAGLLKNQGRYSEAEQLYERCQAMEEKTLGLEHPNLATTFGRRAVVLQRQGRYSEAEQLYERCQAKQEKTLGLEHPRLASTLGKRAELLGIQGRYSEAEPLYERCQAIQEKSLGLEHPDLAVTLGNRAGMLHKQGRYSEAEQLYMWCQAMEERILGLEHPDVAATLGERAELLQIQGRYLDAEQLYERCQAIQEKSLGLEHPDLAVTLGKRAGMLHKQGRYSEANQLFERCQMIQEKSLGLEHPTLAVTLGGRARLLQVQGRYPEAEQLFERCQAIREKTLGLEHPDLAATLGNRAGLLQNQGRYSEADQLYERCQTIQEKTLGLEHPDLAATLGERAELLQIQGRCSEANQLFERCHAIQEMSLHLEHPDLAATLRRRTGFLEQQMPRNPGGER